MHAQVAALPDAPSAVMMMQNDALEYLSQSFVPGYEFSKDALTSATNGVFANDGLNNNDADVRPVYEAFLIDQGGMLEDARASMPSSSLQEMTAPPPQEKPCKPDTNVEVDKDCVPIPLNRQEPPRILGFMPNFRSVSAGAVAHPPGWKYNFKVATRQSFDYSSFIFLGLTSLSAEGLNEHPDLGKGVDGFWNYTWRGFLDKTDGTYLSAWLLPSLLHEDTRYYPMGSGHTVKKRVMYVISREVVTRTYSEHDTPNIAGLGGKVLTQVISKNYYPPGATTFGVLAEKFGYSVMRDVIFQSLREFYPDVSAYYIRRHREKVAAEAAKDASESAKP
jgi:hypothetical protein